MTFAIAGVSGRTGKVAAQTLLARGAQVRVIVRDAKKGAEWKARGAEVAVADLTDVDALRAALQGVAGAYLLVPPNLQGASYRDQQDRVSRALAAAAAKSGISHVVHLSSFGAQHARGNGPIAGLHLTEQLLHAVPKLRVSSIRAGSFYENLASVIGAVKGDGVLPSFYPADQAIAMVSTHDIGELAAELLLEEAPAHRIVQLGTPHTHTEIAAVLGKLHGKPVRVVELALDAVEPTLQAAGFTPDLARLYREMTGAIREGFVAFDPSERQVESREPLERALARL